MSLPLILLQVTMRTIRFSLKKVLVLSISIGLILYLAYSYLKTSHHPYAETVLLKERFVSSKPVFLSDGKLGNFEKYEEVKTGPGEGGKAHRLKPEQKTEEERLKGSWLEVPTCYFLLNTCHNIATVNGFIL